MSSINNVKKKNSHSALKASSAHSKSSMRHKYNSIHYNLEVKYNDEGPKTVDRKMAVCKHGLTCVADENGNTSSRSALNSCRQSLLFNRLKSYFRNVNLKFLIYLNLKLTLSKLISLVIVSSD